MATESVDFFEEIYKITPTMAGSLIFASIGKPNNIGFAHLQFFFNFSVTVANIYFFVKSIWIERPQSSRTSTLLDKFMAKICLLCVIYLILFILTEPLRCTLGPFPEYICFFKGLLAFAVILQILMFLMAIVVTKYIFVFFLSNPLGIDDDFWCRFISIWIFLSSFMLEISVSIFPGDSKIFYLSGYN